MRSAGFEEPWNLREKEMTDSQVVVAEREANSYLSKMCNTAQNWQLEIDYKGDMQGYRWIDLTFGSPSSSYGRIARIFINLRPGGETSVSVLFKRALREFVEQGLRNQGIKFESLSVGEEGFQVDVNQPKNVATIMKLLMGNQKFYKTLSSEQIKDPDLVFTRNVTLVPKMCAWAGCYHLPVKNLSTVVLSSLCSNIKETGKWKQLEPREGNQRSLSLYSSARNN